MMDWRGWLKTMLDDLRRAAQPPRDAVAEDREDAHAPKPERTSYHAAFRAMNLHQLDQAQNLFLRAVDEDPEHAADAYAGAACAARGWAGRYEFCAPEEVGETPPVRAAASRQFYELGLARDPMHARCLAGLAQTLEPGDSRVTELLEAAVRLMPRGGLLLWLGDAHLAAGHTAQALQAYEEAHHLARADQRKGAIKRLVSLAETMGDRETRKRWLQELSRQRVRSQPFVWLERPTKATSTHVDEGRVTCPKCRRTFRVDDAKAWSGKRHLACNEPLKLDGPATPAPVWCIVANVVREHAVGPTDQLRVGTRLFCGGAKVHCYPALWGDGYERIAVIGHHRRSHRLIRAVVSWERLENFRVDLVYSPTIVDHFVRTHQWDGSEESRAKAEAFCRGLTERQQRAS